MINRVKAHPLIDTLLSLRGNARLCVWSEPLWGVPYALFTPFFALYMQRIGLTDVQIGAIATVTMVIQMVFSLLSGPVTDKLGRYRTTCIFDTISWLIPLAIWGFAQNFWWFMAAAIVSGIATVSWNSWTCMLVESTEHNRLVSIYTWLTICGLAAAFLAPAAGTLVQKYTVVPVMRVIYLIAFVMMAVKFVLQYLFLAETEQGKTKLSETRGVSLWKLAAGSGDTLSEALKSRQTVCAVAIFVLFNIQTVVAGNFFPLYVTGSLGIPDKYIAYFPLIRSAVMLAFLFGAQRLLAGLKFRPPMLIGLCLYIASTLFLVMPRAEGLARPVLYTLFESFAFAIVAPRKDSLVSIFVDPRNRARVMGMIYALMLGLSAPFGWIAGALSSMNRAFPFYLNIGVFCGLIGVAAVMREVE